MDFREKYALWKQHLTGTPDEADLLAYEADAAEMEEAFYRDLEFGTAGMRGVIGLGTNRINIYMVRRATQGLAEYILQQGRATDGVVIAYDSRIMSAGFARETALTLAANGVKAYLYDKLTGVPQLSYSVLQLGCAAGVAITASHNPAKYNGYKVYGADGGQLAGEMASAVIACIEAIPDPFCAKTMDESAALTSGLLEYVGEALDRRYIADVLSLAADAAPLVRAQAAQLPVVYTPLHGTGLLPVTRVLGALGLQLHVVKQQQQPDGRFPTVTAPNPENPDAFRLAIALAEETGANLLLATDPDCDRLGVAVRDAAGGFKLLTGNQIGCLLLEYLLSRGALPEDAFVVRSIVSSPLADRIAAQYGVEMRQVLTGFKYIAEQIRLSQESGQGHFLFGFEESYGFLAGDFVRDKDACIAAMLVVCAAAQEASHGRTLADALTALYQKYGWFEEHVISITREGMAGLAQIRHAVDSLRQSPPTTIGSLPILAIGDYQRGELRQLASGHCEPIHLPHADVLYYELSCGSLIIRPSGTEPKLKAYLSVNAASQQTAQETYRKLQQGVDALLQPLLA